MATLRKKGNQYFIDYRIQGRRHRKNVGNSKRIAELALKDLEVKLIKGELGFDTKKEADISRLFDEYNNYSTHHSPSSQKRYKAIQANFKAFLEQFPYLTKLSHLNHKFFVDYQAYRKNQSAANKTINMEIACLRTMFALGVKWGFSKDNPTDGVDLLKEEVNVKPEFLTKDQCKKIIDASNEFMKPIVITFLHTGMRKGELEHLEWNDIDFIRKKIKIRYKEDWSPKTSEREIPISDELLSLLEQLRRNKSPDTSLVFTYQGRLIEPNYLRKKFMQLTKLAGFPEITKLHSLRHTFASHLVMAGVDLPTVGKLLGHSDIETTMIYSHLADEHIDKAIDKLRF